MKVQLEYALTKHMPNTHWKDWCWGWSSNTLATWCEELNHWKRPWCWKDWGQEEKGKTEDEMVGWHHQLDGHGFGWTPELVMDREAWRAAVHWVTKSRTQLSCDISGYRTICDISGYHMWLRKSKRSEYDKWRLINRVEMFSGLEHCSMNCSWG